MDLLTYVLAKKYADKVAAGSSVSVPTKISDLQNDSGFVTNTQTDSKIGAHNTNTSAHADIRNLISSLASSKVSTSDLTTAVESALSEAKASGDFKGEKGDKGDTGTTGAKGVDGASVAAIEFTKDADGNIVGGTATLSDNSTVAITISVAEVSE